jgi:(E)-4-hydroxy-3-methylbut-2-enyl-diphosphate synthase
MIKVASLPFDGKRIYVQSMLNKISSDVDGNVAQAIELENAGADIIRVSVPTMTDTRLITAIKKAVAIPLVADIHFNADIAVECARLGADKIRINPGNIGDESKVKMVAEVCKSAGIPIRIGVNSGSIPKKIRAKYEGKTIEAQANLSGDIIKKQRKIMPAEAFAEAAAETIQALEAAGFRDIVISVKSSDVKTMINANRLIAAKWDYPLHLGVTEAGTYETGLIKSAAGIGSLLIDGIGATIRVSLSDDPVKEVKAGRDILKALGMSGGVKVVACPTCGRTRIDVINTARELERRTSDIKKDLTVAVMGCVVNGPGEAKGANIAVAGGCLENKVLPDGDVSRNNGMNVNSGTGGNPYAMLYIDGEAKRKIPAEKMLEVLLEEIEKY